MQTCPLCKGSIRIEYKPFEYKADKKLYTIPNVKTLICNGCNEHYFDKEGNKQIDEYKEDSKEIV